MPVPEDFGTAAPQHRSIALKKLPIQTVGRIVRWTERLLAYTYTVVHRPGRLHGLPDGLSRFPIKGDSIYEDTEPIELLSSVSEKHTPRRWTPKQLVAAIHQMVIAPQAGIHKAIKADKCRKNCQSYCGSINLHQDEVYNTIATVSNGKEEAAPEKETVDLTQPRRGTRNRVKRTWTSEKGALQLTQTEKTFLKGATEVVEVVPGGTDKRSTTQEQDWDLPDFDPEEHKYADLELDEVKEEAEGSQVINEDSIIIEDDPAEKASDSLTYPPEPTSRLTNDVFKEHQLRDAMCNRTKQRLMEEEKAVEQDDTIIPKIGRFYYVKEELLYRRADPLPLQEREDEEKEGNNVGEDEELPLRAQRAAIRKKRRMKAIQDTLPLGRLVVPETLRRDGLWTFHGIPLTGHNGRTKTTEMIQRYFWWPGMTGDIRRRVQGCRKPSK